MTDSEVVEVDSYEPDWTQECDICGASPTVTAVLNGQVVYDSGMCGPCVWGEAAMADPDQWNK